MARKQFEKVTCPKCARTYAILKGSTKAFHCPGSNCHEMVNGGKAASKEKQSEQRGMDN
jgi:ribosomal protein L37AE/L43A